MLSPHLESVTSEQLVVWRVAPEEGKRQQNLQSTAVLEGIMLGMILFSLQQVSQVKMGSFKRQESADL